MTYLLLLFVKYLLDSQTIYRRQKVIQATPFYKASSIHTELYSHTLQLQIHWQLQPKILLQLWKKNGYSIGCDYGTNPWLGNHVL